MNADVLYSDGHMKAEKGSNLRQAQWNPGWPDISVPLFGPY